MSKMAEGEWCAHIGAADESTESAISNPQNVRLIRFSLESCGAVYHGAGSSEQSGLGRLKRHSEVLVGKLRRHTAARRTLQKADLEKVWLVHIFNRIDFLAQHCSDRTDPHRSAAKAFDDGTQQLSIDFVEPVLVHVQELQGRARYRSGNFAGAFDFCVVANALEQ